MNHSGCRRMTKLLCIFWNYPSVTRIYWNGWCMGANWGVGGGGGWGGWGGGGGLVVVVVVVVVVVGGGGGGRGAMRWVTNATRDQWDGGPMTCTPTPMYPHGHVQDVMPRSQMHPGEFPMYSRWVFWRHRPAAVGCPAGRRMKFRHR